MKCDQCHASASFVPRVVVNRLAIVPQCPHCGKAQFTVTPSTPLRSGLKRLAKLRYFVLSPGLKDAVALMMRNANHLADRPGGITFLNVPDDQYMTIMVAGARVSFHFSKEKHPSLADAAVPRTMEFDLSDLNENRVSLAWTDLNGVSAFDAMSKILKEAQTMVDAAVQGVPSQGLRQTVSDSSTLLQLINTGRCRPSGAVASS